MTDTPVEPKDGFEPPEPAPDASLLERLGPRAVRRMTPRIGVAIAGAGALIAVGGATGLGGDRLVSDNGDVQRIPGILLSLLVIVAGYVTIVRVRTGPLATAGATGAALGVPAELFFLTFSTSDFPPFSLDAILLVSSLAWFAAYLIGPGAGRLLFLGAALAGSWLFVLNLIEPVEDLTPFGMLDSVSSFEMETGSSGPPMEVAPPSFDTDGNFVFPGDGLGPAPGPILRGGENPFDFQPPDFTDVAVVSLLFGAVYAVGALLLSRRGYHGAGTPFAAVSIPALVVGVELFAPDLEQVGTGLVSMALGLGLAAIGAASGRRVTAWVGGAGVGLGAIAVLQKGIEDGSPSTQSFAFLVLGIVVVIAGHFLAVALGEPDEEHDAVSFTGTRRRPGGGPAFEVRSDQ